MEGYTQVRSKIKDYYDRSMRHLEDGDIDSALDVLDEFGKLAVESPSWPQATSSYLTALYRVIAARGPATGEEGAGRIFRESEGLAAMFPADRDVAVALMKIEISVVTSASEYGITGIFAIKQRALIEKMKFLSVNLTDPRYDDPELIGRWSHTVYLMFEKVLSYPDYPAVKEFYSDLAKIAEAFSGSFSAAVWQARAAASLASHYDHTGDGDLADQFRVVVKNLQNKYPDSEEINAARSKSISRRQIRSTTQVRKK